MTPARLGAANAPMANPFINNKRAKAGYGKSTGNSSKRPKDRAAASMPPVAKGREPKRSERIPLTGPATRNPTVKGSM